MIYANLSTDANMLEVVTIRSLTDMQWEQFGDAGAREFLSTWIDRTSRLDCHIGDEVLRDILFTEMKKSDALKLPLVPFKNTPKKDQNYNDLLDIFKKHLKENKEDENLRREREQNRRERGGTKAQPAAKMTDISQNDVQQNSPELNPKKKKRKAKKGNGADRSQSVGGANSKSATEPQGFGNPRNASNKSGNNDIPWQSKFKCVYHQTEFNGGLKCSLGDKCKFSHEKVSGQEEYDKLKKPWDTPRNGSSAGGTPRDHSRKGLGKGPGKGKAKVIKLCSNFMACPGAMSGSCALMHCGEDQCRYMISVGDGEFENKQ